MKAEQATCYKPSDKSNGTIVASNPSLPGALGAPFPRATLPVAVYTDGSICLEEKAVICEKTFRIVANGKPLVTLQCSDAALIELTYGFLLSGGVISSMDDIESVSIDPHTMTAYCNLSVPVSDIPFPAISSGFGGKILHAPAVPSEESHDAPHNVHPYSVKDVIRAVGIMKEFAREYTITRGIHCTALFKDGIPLVSFEDIGRHNTFDKVIGRCLIDGQSSEGCMLATTGRISAEMCEKALHAGVSGIASLSGATDIAISVAQKSGILLVGYVRDNSAIIYTGVAE